MRPRDRVTVLAGAMPEVESLRAALRPWCDGEAALDRLELSHVTVGPRGPVRLLLEGPGPDGKVVRLAARRLGPTEGSRVASEMNRGDGGGAGERRGFAQPAIYVPELELLFHVFPTDRDLPSLPAAVDGRTMAPILEARLAARTGGCRVRDVVVECLRYKPDAKAEKAEPRAATSYRLCMPRRRASSSACPSPWASSPSSAWRSSGPCPASASSCSPAPRTSLPSANGPA